MKRPWLAAAGTAALTGLLFSVVYNLCNWITGLRADVGVWAFAWEKHWPLIPAMIVPYWSIDLLFVLAPFLCKTREELAVHRRRIVFVILGGCLGFLAIPLRFAFARPHVGGALAPMFAAIYSFDRPHNLFPSIHIALRTALAALYARKTRGAARWLVHGWFSLIGISTLLVWQHHVADVLGGFWLGAIVLHLYRFDEPPAPRSANRTMAALYALTAFAFSQLARVAWPWTFVLVWPAFAFGVAAFGYAGFGAGIYRKRDGQLTLPTKILLGPLLAAQWLSWIYYRRKSARWNAIAPQVWIGALPTGAVAREAVAAGVTAVLDLTAPTDAQLAVAADFIARESALGIVFVHCKAGYSRSAGAVGAWMLGTGRARNVAEVVTALEQARPGIVIRCEIREVLGGFAAFARSCHDAFVERS